MVIIQSTIVFPKTGEEYYTPNTTRKVQDPWQEVYVRIETPSLLIPFSLSKRNKEYTTISGILWKNGLTITETFNGIMFHTFVCDGSAPKGHESDRFPTLS